MKNIYKMLIVLIVAIFISACSESEKVLDETATSISIIIDDCETSSTDLLSGDVIIQDIEPTVVTTVINADGTQTVCVSIGAAHIER